MGWQPGDGGTGVTPGPEPGPPGDGQATPLPGQLLPGFTKGGKWDTCSPSAALVTALEAASGSQWRCPGASRDEMVGLLSRWQAIESWAVAGKMGVLRALVRDDDEPLPGGGYHGDLPEGWTKSLTHEVALALSMPAVSADKLMWLAWDLEARLPRTGALLAAGRLTCAKASAVDEALQLLSDQDAAAAEARIIADLPGKTYGQVQKLAVQAALAVDPESAARRREDAERNRCRVQLSREESGAAALSGRELPTDQTLAAHASVCARAKQYKDFGAFPDHTRMDQYRATAYLDLLNGISAEARIAAGLPGDGEPGGSAGGGPGGESPGDGSPGGGPLGSPGGGAVPEPVPQLADLVLPLATLLGLADRPGESHLLGPLDPELCRELALAAAGSPWTRLCVTVTDADGIAIGHGCAKPPGKQEPGTKTGTVNSAATGPQPPPGGNAALALPARVNLTITAGRLAEIAATGPPRTSAPRGSPGPTPWSFTSTHDPGPPGAYGTWTLVIPGGSAFTIRLEPVPTFECDHAYESHTYQPNDNLRHLVQVRDYECTFPPCSRHARESDFEHAVPYDKGGRTCACNAGARSRRCHRIKQSPGWNVTQPKPGYHQWTTPTGRTYTQEPWRYIA